MTTSQRLPAGTLLGGRYRLIQPLSGAGRSWHARDEVDRRELVARVVVLPAAMPAADRDLARQRALQDAAAVSRVHHPGIAPVVDAVVEDGTPWVISVRPAGRSLGEVVRIGGPLSVDVAALVGLQVVDALEAAGVPHGDLTPDDVLLGPNGQVTVMGFATTRVDGTETPGFRAPEGGPSAAADLWALGVTLYVAVEGRLPDGPGGGALRPALDRLLAIDPAQRSDTDEVRRLLAAIGGALPASTYEVHDPDVAAALAALDAAIQTPPPPREAHPEERPEPPFPPTTPARPTAASETRASTPPSGESTNPNVAPDLAGASAPVDRTNPADRAEAVDPREESDPAELHRPADRTLSADPSGHADASRPVDPGRPARSSADVADPVDLAEPARPNEPAGLTEPAGSGPAADPADPTDSTEPARPNQPDGLAEPARPDEPEGLAEPAGPAESADVAEPGGAADSAGPPHPRDPADSHGVSGLVGSGDRGGGGETADLAGGAPVARGSGGAVQGSTRAVERPRTKRWWWGAVAAVGLLVIAILVPVLRQRGDSAPAVSQPATTMTATPAAPTVTSTVAPPPAGYRLYRDPAGWSIAVPQAWPATRKAGAVTFRDGDHVLTVRKRPTPPADPYTDLLAKDKARGATIPGYEFLRVARIPYRAWSTADWEYRAGTAPVMHTVIRTTVAASGEAYDISWTTEDRRWGPERGVFQTAVRTFDPGD
jgi:serine/threonine protein kinase